MLLGGEFNDVRTELKRLTELPNHYHTTSGQAQVNNTQEIVAPASSALALPTSFIRTDPLTIQPVGEEEEEEEERTAIEEHQRQSAVKSFLNAKLQPAQAQQLKTSHTKKPPVKPKPKSASSSQEQLPVLVQHKTSTTINPITFTKTTSAAVNTTKTTTTSDTKDTEDPYDDVLTSMESYNRTQSHSLSTSVPLIPAMEEEEEWDTYEDMVDQTKSSTNLDDMELYDMPDSAPRVAGYITTPASQIEDEDVYL